MRALRTSIALVFVVGCILLLGCKHLILTNFSSSPKVHRVAGVVVDPNFRGCFSTETRRELEAAAEQGKAQAAADLAVYYLESGTNRMEAFRWLTRAADLGHTLSGFRLMILRISGSYADSPEDEQKAFQALLTKTMNDSLKGLEYLRRNQPPFLSQDIRQKLAKETEIGNSRAAADLGLYYTSCSTQQVDAFYFLQKAAELGDSQSQYYLGLLYLESGSDKDRYRAFRWLQKSAEQDNVEGMLAVAKCSELGIGPRINNFVAKAWIDRALDLGRDFRRQDYPFRSYLSQDQREALFREVESGAASAAKRLSDYYYDFESDGDQGLFWLEKSAALGDVKAQYSVGLTYALPLDRDDLEDDGATTNDLCSVRDANKAFHWFLTSASNGYASGMLEVGLCYARGAGTSKDTEKAVLWLEKMLANMDDLPSEETFPRHKLFYCHRNLGIIYLEVAEPRRDFFLAYVHLSRAQDLFPHEEAKLEELKVRARNKLNKDERRKAERQIKLFDKKESRVIKNGIPPND